MPTATEELVELYQRGGCIRQPNPVRRAEEKRTYKKGYEVRLYVTTKTELTRIRRLLRQVGFKKLGSAYGKHRGYIQPLYGQEAVKWFRLKSGEETDEAPKQSEQKARTGKAS
ncbi:MAG: hypothetical protein L0241_01020 [Planctomycetia bacterium]|nr:hypothetical protein [Planctomycetia bacterium]